VTADVETQLTGEDSNLRRGDLDSEDPLSSQLKLASFTRLFLSDALSGVFICIYVLKYSFF